jgi:hypothetical protein
MADEPTLIVQVPLGSAIERQLRDEPPPPFRTDEVLVQTGATDDQGTLEELAGEVVFSVPSPQELPRQGDDLHRVLRAPGTGTSPLVIVVEAAEVLQDEEAAVVLAAARNAPRPVILRVIRPSER